MNIDLNHLHHYMNAIRQSSDPLRTLDAFYRGQIQSKLWLIENLKKHIDKEITIEIHGGWVGLLASLIFQSIEQIKHITSIDIDKECEKIAMELNHIEVIENRFVAKTINMCEFKSNSDVVINTSCEHISEIDYSKWLSNINKNQLLVLQSNNYQITEHIRIAKNLNHFKSQSNISNVLFEGEIVLPLYTRYMIIGTK